MKPNKLGGSQSRGKPFIGPSARNQFFIGPPTRNQVPLKPHKKWSSVCHKFGYTETWVELGIDIASGVATATVKKLVAKQLASKFSTKLTMKYGSDTASKILGKIAFADIIAHGIASNDLVKWKGVRIEISWDWISSQDCSCQISKDHGVEHGIIPVKNVKFNVFLV